MISEGVIGGKSFALYAQRVNGGILPGTLFHLLLPTSKEK
jgi:hypothetical protein